MSPARSPRALAVLLAVLIGVPATLALAPAGDAAAQVWKPKSRAKAKAKPRGDAKDGAKAKKGSKAKARGSESKTRKAGAAKTKRSKKVKATKRARATKPVRDDDDFTYVEEYFPDDDD